MFQSLSIVLTVSKLNEIKFVNILQNCIKFSGLKREYTRSFGFWLVTDQGNLNLEQIATNIKYVTSDSWISNKSVRV